MENTEIEKELKWLNKRITALEDHNKGYLRRIIIIVGSSIIGCVIGLLLRIWTGC